MELGVVHIAVKLNVVFLEYMAQVEEIDEEEDWT